MGLIVWAAGCGDSRGTVSGKVFYKSKPMPGGSVLFIHEKGAFSSGIKEDGTYQIAKIPAGEVKIVVTAPWTEADLNDARRALVRPSFSEADWERIKQKKPPDVDEASFKQMMMGGPVPQNKHPPFYLPPKYGNPEQSGLSYTVTGGSQTYDIKLE